MRLLPSHVVLLGAALCFTLSVNLSATVYRVGPGQALESIGDVPWEVIAAGDLVEIYWRSTPYRDKFIIAGQGSAAAPIVVRGIPNPAGELPVLDGWGATTRTALNYGGEARGIIKIGYSCIPARVPPCAWFESKGNNCVTSFPCPGAGDNTTYDGDPSYITIEGLHLLHFRPGENPNEHDFINDGGDVEWYDFNLQQIVPVKYQVNAAGIFIESGRNITIRNCIFEDGGNGIFSDEFTHDLLIEGCRFTGNGTVGSDRQHNAYTEAHGVTYQYNWMGSLRDGAAGNNLKDRSSDTVIRYNWIEGGGRQIDLVDTGSQDVFNDAGYQNTYVYGNVLIETHDEGNRQIVHFGGDQPDVSLYRKGNLYFHHNTVLSYRTSVTSLFRLHNHGQVYCRNNIIYLAVNTATSALSIMDIDEDPVLNIEFSRNWVNQGVVVQHQFGTVSDLIQTKDPGFGDLVGGDLTLRGDSVCRDVSFALVGNGASHPALCEYQLHQYGSARRASGTSDLGAFEYQLPAAIAGSANDTIRTDEDVAFVGFAANGVLVNDFLPRKKGVVPIVLTEPQKGHVRMQSDGGLTYTPDADANGSDSFTYALVELPPQIISAIATYGDAYDLAYSAGDRVKIVFDTPTDWAGGSGLHGKSTVDSLFQIRGAAGLEVIGADYQGCWKSNTCYEITVQDITGADAIAPGASYVRPVGALPIRSASGLSDPAFQDSPVLSGMFELAPIQWTSLVNAAAEPDGTLSETSDSASGWVGGGVSVQSVSEGNGIATYVVHEPARWVAIGWGDGNPGISHLEMDFCLKIHSQNALAVYEFGQIVKVPGNPLVIVKPGDQLAVELRDGAVLYWYNGTVHHTSTRTTADSVFPLYVDVSLGALAKAIRAWVGLPATEVEPAASAYIAQAAERIADSATVSVQIAPVPDLPALERVATTASEVSSVPNVATALAAPLHWHVYDPDGRITGWYASLANGQPPVDSGLWLPNPPDSQTVPAVGESRVYAWIRYEDDNGEVVTAATNEVFTVDAGLEIGRLLVDDQVVALFGYHPTASASLEANDSTASGPIGAVFVVGTTMLTGDFQAASAAVGRWRVETLDPVTTRIGWELSELLDGRKWYLQPLADGVPSGPAIDMLSTTEYLAPGWSEFELCHADSSTQSVTLPAGWQTFGAALLTTQLSEEILAGAGAGLDTVFSYRRGRYRKVSELVPGRGYWAFLDSPATIAITGVPASGLIPLRSGWNMISPGSATLQPSGLEVWRYDAALEGMIPVAAHELLQPSQAYWVFSKRAETLRFGSLD